VNAPELATPEVCSLAGGIYTPGSAPTEEACAEAGGEFVNIYDADGNVTNVTRAHNESECFGRYRGAQWIPPPEPQCLSVCMLEEPKFSPQSIWSCLIWADGNTSWRAETPDTCTNTSALVCDEHNTCTIEDRVIGRTHRQYVDKTTGLTPDGKLRYPTKFEWDEDGEAYYANQSTCEQDLIPTGNIWVPFETASCKHLNNTPAVYKAKSEEGCLRVAPVGACITPECADPEECTDREFNIKQEILDLGTAPTETECFAAGGVAYNEHFWVPRTDERCINAVTREEILVNKTIRSSCTGSVEAVAAAHEICTGDDDGTAALAICNVSGTLMNMERASSDDGDAGTMCAELGGIYTEAEPVVLCALNVTLGGCNVYTGQCRYRPAVEAVTGVHCSLNWDLSSCSDDSDAACEFTPTTTVLAPPDREACVGLTLPTELVWVDGLQASCAQACGADVTPTPPDRFACEELLPGTNVWTDGQPSFCMDCSDAEWFDCRDGVTNQVGRTRLSCEGEPSGNQWTEKSQMCVEACSGRVLEAYTDRIMCEGTTGWQYIPEAPKVCMTPCGMPLEPTPYNKESCESVVYPPHVWTEFVDGNCTDKHGYDVKFDAPEIVDRATCERAVNPGLSGSYVCEKPVRRVAINTECPAFSTDLFTTVFTGHFGPMLTVTDVTGNSGEEAEYESHDESERKWTVLGMCLPGMGEVCEDPPEKGRMWVHKHAYNFPYEVVPKGPLSDQEQAPHDGYMFLVATGREYLLAFYDQNDAFVAANVDVSIAHMLPTEQILFHFSHRSPYTATPPHNFAQVTRLGVEGWPLPSPGLHWNPKDSLSQLPPYRTGDTMLGYLVSGCALDGVDGHYYPAGAREVGPLYLQPDEPAYCVGTQDEGLACALQDDLAYCAGTCCAACPCTEAEEAEGLVCAGRTLWADGVAQAPCSLLPDAGCTYFPFKAGKALHNRPDGKWAIAEVLSWGDGFLDPGQAVAAEAEACPSEEAPRTPVLSPLILSVPDGTTRAKTKTALPSPRARPPQRGWVSAAGTSFFGDMQVEPLPDPATGSSSGCAAVEERCQSADATCAEMPFELFLPEETGEVGSGLGRTVARHHRSPALSHTTLIPSAPPFLKRRRGRTAGGLHAVKRRLRRRGAPELRRDVERPRALRAAAPRGRQRHWDQPHGAAAGFVALSFARKPPAFLSFAARARGPCRRQQGRSD
jgi:hypothetical protein